MRCRKMTACVGFLLFFFCSVCVVCCSDRVEGKASFTSFLDVYVTLLVVCAALDIFGFV